MPITFHIELGNVWDCLSAVGTVGACAISLYLVRKEQKRDLAMTLVWGQRKDYTAEIVCYNPSNQEVVLGKIYCKYCGKSYDIVDLLNDINGKLECEFPPHETKRVLIQMPSKLYEMLSSEEKKNRKGIKYNWHYRIKRQIERRLSIVAVDLNGKEYKSSQKYDRETLLELFSGRAFMEGFNGT